MASLLFSDLSSTRWGKELFFGLMQAKEILTLLKCPPCSTYGSRTQLFSATISSRFYPFKHNLLCLRTFLQANRDIQLSIPNIDNQVNLQVLSTQSSLVSPHYLPSQSNQLSQLKPTFKLSEPCPFHENFSDTDQKFRCNHPRIYVPPSVSVVQPSARR